MIRRGAGALGSTDEARPPMDDPTNADRDPDRDDPDRVRRRIAADQAAALSDPTANQAERPGRWSVFETIAADGSLAIGITAGAPDPSAVMVVYVGLAEPVAKRAAAGLAGWYRDHGRDVT